MSPLYLVKIENYQTTNKHRCLKIIFNGNQFWVKEYVNVVEQVEALKTRKLNDMKITLNQKIVGKLSVFPTISKLTKNQSL
jgi:hypothetical protein